MIHTVWHVLNDHVDTFSVSQLYAIIILPNGGPDLEAYQFATPSRTGWRQACSIFWQVAKALGHAEQLVSFEVDLPIWLRFSPILTSTLSTAICTGAKSLSKTNQ